MPVERRYDTVFWDLDGTLTDPKDGITRCVQHALTGLGIEETDLGRLLPFIGPPLLESFRVHYGLSLEDAQRAVGAYRERFARLGMFENRIYDGIETLLFDLARAGVRLAVATAKPTLFAVQILRHFGLAGTFCEILGSELDGRRTAKREVLEELFLRLGGVDRARAVMVGDHPLDVRAAHEAGIDAIAVTYGYGERAALLAALPSAVAHSVCDLRHHLLMTVTATDL